MYARADDNLLVRPNKALFLAPPALGEDDVLLFQALDGLEERLLAQPPSPIEVSAVARP